MSLCLLMPSVLSIGGFRELGELGFKRRLTQHLNERTDTYSNSNILHTVYF